MLLNDFYRITKTENKSGNDIISEIEINPEHEIFKGHFPGNPVMPGVVSLQIIKEAVSLHTGKDLMLKQAKNIKFTAMIKPDIFPVLSLKINCLETENNEYKVNARIYFNETVFLKLSGLIFAVNDNN